MADGDLACLRFAGCSRSFHVLYAVAHRAFRCAGDSLDRAGGTAGGDHFGFQLLGPCLTLYVAAQYGKRNIRCNAILPGTVEGDRIRRVFEAKAQVAGKSMIEIRNAALANVSLKTMIAPQELADMAVFLASPRGKTISGQAISIDGDTQALV